MQLCESPLLPSLSLGGAILVQLPGGSAGGGRRRHATSGGFALIGLFALPPESLSDRDDACRGQNELLKTLQNVVRSTRLTSRRPKMLDSTAQFGVRGDPPTQVSSTCRIGLFFIVICFIGFETWWAARMRKAAAQATKARIPRPASSKCCALQASLLAAVASASGTSVYLLVVGRAALCRSCSNTHPKGCLVDGNGSGVPLYCSGHAHATCY